MDYFESVEISDAVPGRQGPRLGPPNSRTRRIGDKDGWKCGICQLEVDPERWRSFDPWSDLPWPDQLRPEVDHKIPQNCGGSDADSNLQIAHAACNRHKHFDPQPPPELARRHLAERRRDDAWELECGDRAVRWSLARERRWWWQQGVRMPRRRRGLGNRSGDPPLTLDDVQARLHDQPSFAGRLVNMWALRMGAEPQEARADLAERFSGDLAVGTWSSGSQGRWILTAAHVWVVRARTAEILSMRQKD